MVIIVLLSSSFHLTKWKPYVENGEASMKTVAKAIGRMLGLPEETEATSLDKAIAQWGAEMTHFAFGFNSRVRAAKARKMLD